MRKKIIDILQKACALCEEITQSSELKMLSLDSLSFVEAIVEMEKEFGIAFDIDELDIRGWNTVDDIVCAVEKKIHDEK